MSTLVEKLIVLTVGTGIIAALGLPTYSYVISDTVRTKINGTEVKRYGDNNHDKYLIFTDAGTFENTDAWYRGKFTSSDLQGELVKLKEKEADITKYGWRFGPFSWYENIVDVSCK